MEPFETHPDAPVLDALLRATEEASGSRAPTVGVPAWTDAHNFVELAGSQAVVWGPGDFGLAHDAGEAIAIDEVVVAARTIETLLGRLDGWAA